MRSLALLLLVGCGGATAPQVPVVADGTKPESVERANTEDLDLHITFDPRISGNIGWDRLPEPIPFGLIGDVGAKTMEWTAERGGPELLPFVAPKLADTTLELDEASVCSNELRETVAKVQPRRLLITLDSGLGARAVGCIASLSTPRIYLTGCLFRSHRAASKCDGDTELAFITGDESLRSRIHGLAVSLARPESAELFAKLPALEYLALSPGRGTPASLVDALPFRALPRVRYLAAAGENEKARPFGRDAARFFAQLHTLDWAGAFTFPLPAPCALKRVGFDEIDDASAKALASCTSLEELGADEAHVDSVEPLLRFPALQRLHLQHLSAADLSPFAKLAKLQHLSIGGTRTKNFYFLTSLTELRTLDLSHGALASTVLLETLVKLERLDLAWTAVSDISPIRGCTQLQRLDLHGTKVEDLTVVAQFSSLRELEVAETPVRDLKPLANLPKLEVVMIYETKITDAAPLLTLPKLKRVNTRGLKLPADQTAELQKRLGGDFYQL